MMIVVAVGVEIRVVFLFGTTSVMVLAAEEEGSRFSLSTNTMATLRLSMSVTTRCSFIF